MKDLKVLFENKLGDESTDAMFKEIMPSVEFKDEHPIVGKTYDGVKAVPHPVSGEVVLVIKDEKSHYIVLEISCKQTYQ